MKLNELAKEYEPVEFKNISDFEKIPTDIDVQTKTQAFENKETHVMEDKEVYFVKLQDPDSETERILEVTMPKSVVGSLKFQLEKNPNVKFFCVERKGEGQKTKYTTTLLME